MRFIIIRIIYKEGDYHPILFIEISLINIVIIRTLLVRSTTQVDLVSS
jgi:hypothetical protein